jgi:hypothetical protein
MSTYRQFLLLLLAAVDGADRWWAYSETLLRPSLEEIREYIKDKQEQLP